MPSDQRRPSRPAPPDIAELRELRTAHPELAPAIDLPPGDAVQSVAWSNDVRDVLITTSGKVLALDTRTWRLESIPRLAAAARDDAEALRRR